MSLRYLDVDKVTLPSRAPLFVEPGHCQWCNKPLTGKATRYCRPTPEELLNYLASPCAIHFLNWWCSRPAYVRATFIKDNFTCQQCGFHRMQEDRPWLPDLSQLECDHIIPLARGGETEMGNLQTLCKVCNRKKGAKVPGEPQESSRVIPSKDKTRCPQCRAPGYRVLPWEVPDYYDPLMIKVECTTCGEESYIGPGPPIRRSGRLTKFK